MGAIEFSIDIRLVAFLKQQLPLEVFVETGTFEGAAVDRVRPFFDQIYTVEASPQYFAAAREKFRSDPGIHVHSGDSVAFLKEQSVWLRARPILFWLDAHWCGAKSAGGESQSPLLGELEAIGELASQSVMLIDDARLYLAPPPPPHCVEQWPDLHDLLRCLASLSSAHRLMVFNDAFLFYPEVIHTSLKSYAHQVGVDWLMLVHKSGEYERLFAEHKQVLHQLDEKDTEIKQLLGTAEERRKTIVDLHETAHALQKDLSDLRKSTAYRLGYVLSNPWRASKRGLEILFK